MLGSAVVQKLLVIGEAGWRVSGVLDRLEYRLARYHD